MSDITQSDMQDFFQTGPPTIKWEIGQVQQGYIARIQKVQARSYETGLPETWPDGNPVLQLVFWLAEKPGQEAYGRLYARKPSSLLNAIGKACQKAGGVGYPEIGGRLAIRRDADGDPPIAKSGRALNAPHAYSVNYTVPAPLAADDFGFPAAATQAPESEF